MTTTANNATGDYLVHGLAADGYIRVLCARSTSLVEEARARHNLWPIPAAALGRALTGAALLAASLKGRERIQIQIVGDGPLRHVTVGADADGKLRGYVGNPYVDLPSNASGKLNVGGAVGSGFLHVIKDLGLKEPYRSTLPLVSGEIAEDLTHYLVASEQRPSVVALGVLVDTDGSVRASGGFVVQLMPGYDEALVEALEERVRAIPSISHLMDEGNTPEEVAAQLTEPWGEPRWLQRKDLRFACDCSRERFERALIALGPEELEDMIEEQGGAELTCHFCADRYYFTADELRNLAALARAKQNDGSVRLSDT